MHYAAKFLNINLKPQGFKLEYHQQGDTTKLGSVEQSETKLINCLNKKGAKYEKVIDTVRFITSWSLC